MTLIALAAAISVSAAPQDQRRAEADAAYLRAVNVRDVGTGDQRAAAEAGLERAVAVYREIGDQTALLNALVEQAWLQNLLARPALYATATEAVELARRIGTPAVTARAIRMLALGHERRGEMADALRLLQESIAAAHAAGDDEGEWSALNNMGVIYGRTGEGDKAIDAFERALTHARAVHSQLGESRALNNLGIAYKNIGELEKSLERYEAARPLFEARGDVRGEILVLNNIGNTRRLLGEPRKALDVHQRALDVARSAHIPEEEARSLNTLGLTHYALGEFERALDEHRQSLAIRRTLDDLPGVGASQYGVGRALVKLGRHEEALAALDEALAVRKQIREEYGQPDTLEAIAAAERALGRHDEALRHLQAAVDLNETLRQRITSPELRASFQGSANDTYAQLIDLLQQQQRAADALVVSERARARVLLDSMLDARVDLRAGADPMLLARERTLQKRLNDASTRLSRTLAAGTSPQEAAAAVDRLTADLQDLQAQIRRQSPRYASVTLPQPLSARDIQQQVVDRDTVLLEFALGDERSWLWAVTTDGVSTAALPGRAEIARAVRALYQAVITQQRASRQARAVSQMLLGGIAEQLNGPWRTKRLAVVASGVLEYVPFGMLPLGPGTLLANHEVVTIPSASVLAALRRSDRDRPRPDATIAVLADPVFEATDPRLLRRSSAATVASAVRGRRVVRLPFSRREADAIATLAGPGAVRTITDFEASRATALGSAVGNARIVHFATHGWLDDQHPDLTGLVLSLVDEHGKPRDGLLRLDDVYNMRLAAELVVLSACETKLGEDVRGEGLVSLTRAFMYAGAPRVIASLWQVSDVATAELMKRLYSGILKRGLSPAAALRAAQLEMSRDPRWASPYFWSGFVLQGDWTALGKLQ